MRTVGNGARTEGGQGGQHGTIGSEKKQGPRETLGNNLAGEQPSRRCSLWRVLSTHASAGVDSAGSLWDRATTSSTVNVHAILLKIWKCVQTLVLQTHLVEHGLQYATQSFN